MCSTPGVQSKCVVDHIIGHNISAMVHFSPLGLPNRPTGASWPKEWHKMSHFQPESSVFHHFLLFIFFRCFVEPSMSCHLLVVHKLPTVSRATQGISVLLSPGFSGYDMAPITVVRKGGHHLVFA